MHTIGVMEDRTRDRKQADEDGTLQDVTTVKTTRQNYSNSNAAFSLGVVG